MNMRPGWITEVEYVRTIDGDTYEFQIRRTFNIRLKDIDVYERSTERGLRAKEYCEKIFSAAQKIMVFIPSNDPVKLMDVNSFSRLVGEVEVDGENLATILRDAGFEKRG